MQFITNSFKRLDQLDQSKATYPFKLTIINHTMLGDITQCSVHVEHASTRRNNFNHLTRPIKVSVDVVIVKYCEWGGQRRWML